MNCHVPAMREQLTTPQKENKNFKKYDTHPLSKIKEPMKIRLIFANETKTK